MVEFLLMVWKALKARHSEDPATQLAWRQAVAGALFGVILVGIFSFFWAQGRLPGLSGVALADDLKKMSVSIESREKKTDSVVASVQMILVKNGIKQALKDRCNAIYARNQAAIDAANNDLDAFSDQYMALTSRPFTPPPCDVVLISPGNDVQRP